MSSQLEKLRALLAAITPGNRFQTARLAAAGVDAGVQSLAEFSARMPFTTKAELVADQAANPPHGSNLTFPIERYSRFCQTSGTTARPLVILDTAESWDWLLGNWEHIYRAAGLAPGDRIYFAFSFGPFLGFWTAFEAAAKLGFLCLPGGGEAVAPRAVGELVLTTLGRAACPLLRYRTGDLVQRIAGDAGFALEGGIIGRADDMVVVRGVNLYPSAVDAVVRARPGIAEYRVEVSRRGALTEVALQVEGEDAAAEELAAALTSAFSLRIPVTRVARGTLPRFEMKARRWVGVDE